MLDKNYIAEIEALGGKEAKEALAEYANGFGISVKKTRSFDNMVKDLESGLLELANEPMPEEQEGMTITDIINAADSMSGQMVFDEPKALATELMIDTPLVEEIKVIDVKDGVADIVIKPINVVKEVVLEVSPNFELPKHFNPTLNMLGNKAANSYVTLPWWIYEWISKNPDWKKNPKSFPHAYGLDSLFSLIYYINRDGFVRIRETRNSSFVVLE